MLNVGQTIFHLWMGSSVRASSLSIYFCFSFVVENGCKIGKCRSSVGHITPKSMYETSVESVRYIFFGFGGDASGCVALVWLVDVHGSSCWILSSAWNMFVRNAMAFPAHTDPGQCLRRHEVIDREETDAGQTHCQIHFRQTVSICVQCCLHHELAQHLYFASTIFR